MKKSYEIDSQLEPELIECYDERKSAIRIMDEYIQSLREHYREVEIVEDYGTRKVIKVTAEVKVIDVPTEEDWNSIEKWNYI